MSHTSPIQPGLTPPPGVTPDFESPYTLQPCQAIVIAACIISTTTFLIARLYTKARIVKAVKWEDCEDLPSTSRWARLVSLLTLARFLCNRMGKDISVPPIADEKS